MMRLLLLLNMLATFLLGGSVDRCCKSRQFAEGLIILDSQSFVFRLVCDPYTFNAVTLFWFRSAQKVSYSNHKEGD